MNIKKGRRFKTACFAMQGTASFASAFYSFFLYFLMRKQFGFDDKHNLFVAATLGLVCALAAWQAGRFAQRFGYFTALKLGFTIVIAAMSTGTQVHSAAGVMLASALMTVGTSFLWPTIEALVSEGETVAGLQRAIGTYNVVWAATNALALFIGGTLVEKFGFRCIFYIPLVLAAIMLVLVFWLEKHTKENIHSAADQKIAAPEPNRPSRARAQTFQRMAWLANPFAYIAINTLTAVMPGLAAKFQLSPMLVGFICSLWCFVRLGVFAGLWHWTHWHYRFRWLALAFLLLIASFAAILTAPNLEVLIEAQILFGGAIGLIYYSSLFYSMDASDTKGEHGGIHEAAIGLGNCVGPGIGAAALQFLPQYADSGVIAVSVLLLGGFGGLVTIWKTAK
jgi:MFS family permease